MALSSLCWLWHDVAVETYWLWHCQVDVGHGMMSLLRRLGHGEMLLSSHASDGAAGVTRPRRDVDVESCWHGATKATWSWRDGAAESC
jgi:hypothetical protein